MNNRQSRLKNLGLAGIAALTGFIALTIVIVALMLGLWLDARLGQRGPATVCLLVLSVPFSLFVMVRIALALVSHIDVVVPSQEDVVTQEGVVTSDEKEE